MQRKKETSPFYFWKVPVNIMVEGPLHATTPSTPEGIEYMLTHTPSDRVLAARKAAGEPIATLEELEEQVAEEAARAAAPPEEQRAVFRRDEEKQPFVHDNFIKGHLRSAGEALSRPVNFWGLQSFINTTLFVRPKRIYLEGEIKVERWPTHFDIYRKGRVSSFREAEYVENPRLAFNIYLVNDPRWNKNLLRALFEYGAVRGMGGGRGRGMGGYSFELREWEMVSPDEAWKA